MIEKKVLQNEIDWQKLNDLFAAACDLEAAEREEFLRQISDAKLRRKVAAMLKTARKAESDGFLEKNAFPVGAKLILKEEKLAEKRIGKYKIVREIGRGGMGAVYLAEREDFKQQVALKIIKRGMDTDDVIKRFRRERQLLASLNHPYIARLLDGGMTERDLPFFVMEYVEGVPITEFCDREKLNIEERLALFRKVCSAVAYAHQNLIVHRDLKPSNILVTKDGEPKLLDFGISKLLTSNVSDMTVEQTAAEMRLMTPEYASPEQIRGEQITTVSDIYSLGVLLYELLSGHRPLKLKNRPSAEILKIVCEQEPPTPSTAALTVEEIIKGDTKKILSPETIAEVRGEKPERLRRRLAGDLDNIVLMSLRKEPSRRYSSVEQFSEDLRRHLEGLPVKARRATFVYTTNKFVRRNRKSVAFAGFALLLIFLGFSTTVWQAVVARKERTRAEQRFNEVRKLANTLINGWEKDLTGIIIPFQVRARLADISAEYLENLTREAGNDPALLRELAEAHIALGHEYAYQFINSQKAESSFRQAEQIARRLIASDSGDLQAKDLLARSLEKYDEFFGERDNQISLQNRLERLHLRGEILAANPDDEQALAFVSRAYGECQSGLERLGRHEEAEIYARRAEEILNRRIEIFQHTANTPDERAKLVGTLMKLASYQSVDPRRLDTAIENSRRAFEIAQAVYTEKPEIETIANAAYSHGLILKKANDHRGAIEAFRIAVETSRALNPRSLSAYLKGKEFRSLLEIAESLHESGETEKALVAARESLEIRRKWMEFVGDKAAGEQDFRHGIFFHSGGRLLVRMKKFDEAERVFREAEESFLKVLEGSPDKIINRRNFAQLYLTIGDFYGGIGVCSFERFKPYGDIGNNYVYCPPETNDFVKNRNSLQKASEYYKKAVHLLSEIEAANSATSEDKENLRLGIEKIEICARKLNGKS